MEKFASGVLVLTVTALIGSFFWWNWATGAVAPELKVHPPAGGSKLKAKEEIFVVKRGEGINSVAKRLGEEELIRSALAFRILMARQGLAKKIQAGDFRLNPGMTLLEIARQLTHGTLDIWVTIIEGWRAEEIAEEINSKFEIRNSKFLADAKGHEGYLFPDTYLIPKEASAEKIIGIFLKNFEKKFNQKLQQEAGKQGLAVDQVLTLASIVEREARDDQDRPMVAGILIKRWQNDWPLQADATIQYAVASQKFRQKGGQSPAKSSAKKVDSRQPKVNWWPKNLTKQDLRIDSSYNTYENKGLPPTPICNPGLASIKAVIYPQQTDFWYYLSDPSGQMHYAKTAEEHAENINKYLR